MMVVFPVHRCSDFPAESFHPPFGLESKKSGWRKKGEGDNSGETMGFWFWGVGGLAERMRKYPVNSDEAKPQGVDTCMLHIS